MLRNGLTGDWIGTFVGHKGAVWGCCLDKNALRCATASADFSARVFDAVSGDELACLPHSHIVRTVAFAPDGRSLVTGGYEKLLRVYDLSSLPASASAAAAKASALAEAPPPPAPLVAATAPDKIRRALFNADGLLLTSYIDAPGLGVWDLRSGKCVKTLETGCVVSDFNFAEGGEASSSGASPSPSSAPSSSSTLVVAGGKAASIYDASTFSLVKSFGFDFGINSAAFEPARSRVVAGEYRCSSLSTSFHSLKTRAKDSDSLSPSSLFQLCFSTTKKQQPRRRRHVVPPPRLEDRRGARGLPGAPRPHSCLAFRSRRGDVRFRERRRDDQAVEHGLGGEARRGRRGRGGCGCGGVCGGSSCGGVCGSSCGGGKQRGGGEQRGCRGGVVPHIFFASFFLLLSFLLYSKKKKLTLEKVHYVTMRSPACPLPLLGRTRERE